MDLHRRSGDPLTGARGFHATTPAWLDLLRSADEGGWERQGTILYDNRGQPDREWNGGYGTNDEQYVTPEDATAMADAIERAKEKSEFCRKYPEFVDQFIEYCRGGGFEIH